MSEFSVPMPKFSSISRKAKRKPQVVIGRVTGKVRLSGQALEDLRKRVYRRDGGRCQWKDCGIWLPFYGSVFNRAHMAHIKSRGAGGSDELSNVRLLCPCHHLGAEHTKGLQG
jgi:5-methylcytosine-specific restriction endonuclease McrA